MGKSGKTFAFFLTLIIAISCLTLLIAKPARAQTGVTQPIVPRFDVFLNTQPIEIPPTYGVDPSTGKAVMTKAGYEVLYKWVGVRVYGQPFWEYNNSAGQRILLYYYVRWQSNLDIGWQTLPSEVNYYHDSMDPWDTQGGGYPISIAFKGNDNGGVGMQLLDPDATEIGFQVEALVGYYNSNNVFVGQSSGWSNTQTITVSAGSVSASTSSPTSTSNPTTPNPTSTSTVPEFSSWTLPLLLSIMAATAGLLVYHKRSSVKKL